MDGRPACTAIRVIGLIWRGGTWDECMEGGVATTADAVKVKSNLRTFRKSHGAIHLASPASSVVPSVKMTPMARALIRW